MDQKWLMHFCVRREMGAGPLGGIGRIRPRLAPGLRYTMLRKHRLAQRIKSFHSNQSLVVASLKSLSCKVFCKGRSACWSANTRSA